MQLPKSVKENLFFLLAETASQVSKLQVVTETASASVAQRIMDRQGYSYNLKMRVHDGCLMAMRRGKKGDYDLYSLRAAEIIASGLERISDICQDCVSLMGKMSRKDSLKKQSSSDLLDDIQKGIDLIERAVEADDSRAALRISHIERKLDRTYDKAFRSHVRDISKKKHPEDVITSLFIVHRIEEMGDVLLDISEALVSAKLGQPIQIDRYRFLENALNDLGLQDVEVEQIAETKSGSGISGISSTKGDDEGYVAIFKDGKKDKLEEEKEKVEDWHEIFPGLAPQIFSYKKKGKNASLLIEHLEGFTFEQLLLQDSDDLLMQGLKRLNKTVKAVWDETKRKKVVQANHMAQLQKRLPSVLQIHGDFDFGRANVCGKKVKSLDQLINSAADLEAKYEPPFSVFIHGDFNLDNIIFDPETNKIRFIDLHRSGFMDYVQDVAVFMVSNYRLQVVDKRTRRRITDMAVGFHDGAQAYAKKNKDSSFDLRVAFGLARSFITSTRFILDTGLAESMFLRGVFILERLDELDKKSAKSFALNIEELFQ